MRLPIRSLATLLVAVGVATCADAPTVSRARPAGTGKGIVAISPVFSKEAQALYAQRATNAALSFDHVRIVLVSPPADTVKDTTIVFNPASPPQTVELVVSVTSTNEVFSGEVDYTNNGAIVYQGISKFTAYPPDQPPPPSGQGLVIVYVGPGASATKLSVTPKSVTVVAPGSASFTVVATDANNAPVPGVPVTWSSSDPSVATVDATSGAVATTGKRGSATITASAPTKAGVISDNGGVVVTLPAASIALVSGGGQSGKAGASLGAAAVVRVLASDGIGVSGVTVNFAAPSGGKVGSSSVTTDPTGLASTSLTLGGVAGPQSFAANAAGFSVSISATATPGDPAIVVAVSGGGQQDTIKHALKAPLIARVTDAFANPVGGVPVSWSVASGSGTLSAQTTTTASDGSTSVGYTLGGAVASETINASVSGVPGVASFTVSAIATGPANIAAVSGSGQAGRVQQALAAPFVVMVTDQAGNPVNGAPVSWAASNGTISGSTTTGVTGQTSNTMTLGSAVGAAGATASIANGKSVSFSATVSPGIVAQLNFRAPPPNGTPGALLAPPILVELRDAAGNLTAAANPVTVAFGTNPSNATLGGTLTRTSAAGVASFNDLTVSAAGNGYTLVATSAGVPPVTSAPFNITGQAGGPPFRLAIVTPPPANNFSGVPLAQQPVIQVQDQAGNPVPASVSVTATFSAGSERNNFLPTNPQTGTVAFTNLIYTGNAAGNAVFSAPGLQSVQVPVSVAQTFLAFQTQPSTVTAGVVMTPPVAVQILNQAGGVIAAANGIVVTLGIASNPGQGALSGVVAVPVANGVASFPTLSINNAGVGYTLGATAIGVTSATSNSFDVIPQSTGQQTSWTGSVSNVWTVAGNWSTVVPGALDDAIIPAGAPNQPAISAATSVKSITINAGASLDVAAVTLTVGAGGVSNSGTLNLNGTNLVGALNNLATTVAQGATNLRGAVTTGAGSTLVARGINTYGAGLLTIANGFTNNGTIQLTDLVAGYGATLVVTSGVLTNAPGGSITPLTGLNGPRGMSGILDNQGTISVTTTQGFAISASTGSLNNSGTITVNGVNLALTLTGTASFASTGTINIGAGGRFVETGGTFDLSAGVVNGPGELYASNGTLLFSPSALTAPLSINNETISPNNITVPSGTTLELFNSSIAAPVTNNGTLLVHGSTSLSTLITGSGSITRIQGINTYGQATLTVANGVTNTATIELTDAVAGYGAAFAVTSGTFVNSAGATLSILQGTSGARTIAAELDNQGAITIGNTPGLTLGRAGATSRNSGTIAVTTGNLTINQTGTTPSFTNTGSITVAAARTLTVNGGTVDLSAGTFSGPGILVLNNATLLFGTSTVTAPLTMTNTTIAGGTVTIPSGQTLDLVNGTMSAPVVNQGLLLIHGSVALNGALTTGANSIVRIEGINTYGAATLTVANGFTNAATIELTDQVAGYGATLAVTNGTLTSSAAGTLSILQGTSGPRTIAAELNNQGTLTIANTQGLALGRAGAAHTNSGTIAVTSGNLTINQTGTTPSFTNTGALALSVGRTLTVNGGTLDLSAGTTSGGGILAVNNATLAFSTSTVTTPLTLTSTTITGGTVTIPNSQQLELVNGTMTAAVVNQGLFLVHGSVALNAALTTGANSIVRIEGINTYGAATLTVANGFTNTATIELTDQVAGYGATLAVTNGTLTSSAAGTLSILQGTSGPRTIAAELNNQGTLTIGNTQGLTIGRAGAAHTNSGTIAVTTGNLTVTQTGTTPTFANTGTVTLAVGRTWTVSGGTIDLSAGTTTGGGILSVNSSTLAFSTTTVTTPLTLNNTTIAGGTVTIPSGQQLELVNGTLTAALVNQGLFLVHGNVALSGALTTASGSMVRIQGINTYGGAALTVANGFTNVNGSTIELTDAVAGYGATLHVTAGTLTNVAGASLSILQGTSGPRTIDAQLDNQGTLTVGDTQGLTLAHTGAAHTNSGTINVTTGDLTLNQVGATGTFTNTGSVAIGAGRTFTMAGSVGGGATLDLSAGTVSGAGTLAASNLTIAFTPLTVTTTCAFTNVSILGGTLTVPVGQTLTLANTTFNSPIVNNGLVLIHGTVNLAGAYTSGANSTLRIEGINTYGGANAVFANGFTNTATIELTDQVAGYGATLTVTNGTLVNASGATLSILQGTSGPRTIAAELNNQATLNIANSTGLTIARAGSAHINTGTISVGGGGLTVNQSGTTPTFTNANGGVITVAGGTNWTVSGGTLDVSTGSVNGGGGLIVNNATLNFSTSTMGLPLTLTNTTIAGGTVTIANGQSLTLANGTMSAPVVNNGLLLIRGSVSLTGALTTGSGSILRIDGINTYGGAVATFANGFTNSAAIELMDHVAGYGATLAVTAGTLTNAASGTITAFQGANGPRTLTAQLDNQGTLAVSTSLGLTINKANATHTNSAVINLTTGDLVVSGGTSFTNSGTITVASGRTFLPTVGTLTNAGVIQGPGTLAAAGVTFINNATLNIQNATTAGSMTVNTAYTQSGAGSALNIKLGGTTAGTTFDRLVVNGTATLGGTLNVTLFNGFSATTGNTFVIMTYTGAPVGNFSTINLPAGCTANPISGQYQIVC